MHATRAIQSSVQPGEMVVAVQQQAQGHRHCRREAVVCASTSESCATLVLANLGIFCSQTSNMLSVRSQMPGIISSCLEWCCYVLTCMCKPAFMQKNIFDVGRMLCDSEKVRNIT